MGRKLRADQLGVFPGYPGKEERYGERSRVLNRMLAQRAGLPKPELNPYGNLGNRELNVYAKKQEIIKALRDKQIIALEGATGSGKSTQIDQYALEMGYKKIIHLVPRILIANNLGDRIASELEDQLGESGKGLVGIHHSERHDNPDALIQVMTPGTYMRIQKDLLERYGDEPILIIGDEKQEKDFETEMAVAVAAQQLGDKPNMRLALVSATMDGATVDNAYGPLVKGDIPHIYVEGRPHELETVEEPELTAVSAYLKYAADHQRSIIFTSGKAEIRELIEALDKACASPNVRILPLHAKLPRSEILKATHADLKEGEKLVIVATSAAQSGITIPGLTLSILDGTIRRPNLDEDGTEGLFKEYCTQDELVQEGGRAGRDVGGGLAVLVKSTDERFPFKSLADRDPHAPAQIYSTNISRNTLLATAMDVSFFDVNEYLIHKVDRRRILDAYEVLWRLQAIDEQNNITSMGEDMNRLPLRPELARSVIFAMMNGAPISQLRQLIATVCSVEAGGLQYFEKGASELWRKDIQPHAHDDYTAQLDMFRATRKHYYTTTDEMVKADSYTAAGRITSGYVGTHSYVNEGALAQRGYDPKNTYRAHHTYDKICERLKIDIAGEGVKMPSEDDIEALRDFLTAGLFDYAHERRRDDRQRGKQGTVSWYGEVTRDIETERYISDRSMLPAKGPDYLIGLPRRFEKMSKGELKIHNVVEQSMPTTLDKLGKHVAHLLIRKPEPGVRLVNGRLTRTDGLYFGDIQMASEPTRTELVHTPETIDVLTKGIFDKPTQTISELIDTKKRLEYLARRVSDRLREKIFPIGLLTEEWLHEKISAAINGEVDNIYALDNNLRAMVVRDDITIRSWISEEDERQVVEHSPDTVELANGTSYTIYWSHGKPLVNGFNALDVDQLPADGLILKDGREVLFSFRNLNGDTKKMTASELIETIEQAKSS